MPDRESGQRSSPLGGFASTLKRLAPDGRLGLAVSGGPDSLALLLLAAKIRPGEVEAATVDHQLRPESAAEAAMVAEQCARLGVPHAVLRVAVTSGSSLQAKARDSRYRALGEWARERGLARVATAHHADDQAETILMRLARGSGIAGLSGIRETATLGGLHVIRPLLAIRKAELARVVESAGLTPLADPSNDDPRHERTRARRLLAATDWLDPVRLARSAAALAEADQALGAAVEEARARHLLAGNGTLSLRDVHSLPSEIRRRLLLCALSHFGAAPSGPELDRLLQSLEEGQSATIGRARVRPGPEGVCR